MARLASIVAPPRLPLTRYHGVLAPNSSWRRQIVQGARASSDPCAAAEWAQTHGKPADNTPKPDAPARDVPNAELPKPDPQKPRSRTSTSYVPWSDLMRRTLGINPLRCVACQATMTLIAVITKPDVILKILSHVKVPRCPVTTDEAPLLYYDVTGEPVPRWAVGVDPAPDERGPPVDQDAVDPPALDT